MRCDESASQTVLCCMGREKEGAVLDSAVYNATKESARQNTRSLPGSAV